jgi:hypothetical protein
VQVIFFSLIKSYKFVVKVYIGFYFTMMNLGPVTEDSVRNYDKDPYKGERSNNDGTQDVGGNFLDMLKEVLRRAKLLKSAAILGPKATAIMSSVVKDILADRLSNLEAVPQPWSAGNLRIMSGIRKDLLDESIQQEKRNTQAETVISIFHAISARNVQLRIEQITMPHYANAEAALDDLKKKLFDEFFGEAYVRARQLQDKIRRVGIAFNPPQVLLLVGVLGGIFDHVKDWFEKTNPDGSRELYDNMVPQLGEPEKLRSLIERMDDSAQSLTLYRTIVSNGMDRGATFQDVGTSIKSKLLTDIPSLNRAPKVETSVVLAARLEDASQNGQMVAFQAGYQMASTHSNKRPLQEETRPYVPAPYFPRENADNVVQSGYVVTCHYWDGDKCGYEEATKKPCRFQEHHKKGVSTFVKDFAVKQSEMELFQEFKRSQK